MFLRQALVSLRFASISAHSQFPSPDIIWSKGRDRRPFAKYKTVYRTCEAGGRTGFKIHHAHMGLALDQAVNLTRKGHFLSVSHVQNATYRHFSGLSGRINQP